MPQPLPVHPRTGLTALGFGKRGPIWPVAGGSEDHDAGGDAGGSGDKGTDSKTGGDAGSADRGFPPNTKTEDMDDAQKAAYWKFHARKNEDALKKLGDVTALKAAATELEQIKAARKTEAEKLAERAEQAEKRAADAELRMLKREIAEEKGIPLAQADRLRGDTREAIESDAEDFAPYVKAEKERKRVDLDQGAGGSGTSKASEASGRDLYAQRRTQPTTTFS